MLRRTLLLPFQLLRFTYRKFSALSYKKKIYLGLIASGLVLYPKYNRRPAVRIENVHKRAITDYIYFDIAMDNQYLGRILIGLYGRILPLTVENFINMCRGFQIKDKRVGYLNSKFDKIVPGRAILGGKLFHPNNVIDSCTIYSKRMPEESFETTFIQEGDVAMVSDGPLGITSRFLITLSSNPGFQQKVVVVGTIVKGMKLIRKLGDTARNDAIPLKDIRIVKCGLYNGPEDGPKSFLNV